MYRNCLLFIGLLASFASISVGHEAIVNGGLAAVNQYPYHVAVNVFPHGYICNGGILSSWHVLTAAHCVVKSNRQFFVGTYILAGTNDFQQTGMPAQIAVVGKIFVPNEYHPSLPSRIADIAVLKLMNPLRMDVPQRPLRHVHIPENDQDDYFDKNGTITGFGWDWVAVNGNAVTGGHIQTQLRHALATVLSKSQCQRNRHLRHISEIHLCARIAQIANGIHGVCTRDDGGPLVFQGIIIGVLSQNPHDCSERRSPGVYTRVSSFLKFIRDVMKN